MQRDWIIYNRWHPFAIQVFFKLIAVYAIGFDCILVKHMGRILGANRGLNERNICQLLIIKVCHFVPPLGIIIQVFQLYFQNGGLKSIETAVYTNDIVLVFYFL